MTKRKIIHPPPKQKRGTIILLSFFDAVYFPSKSPTEKRENVIL